MPFDVIPIIEVPGFGNCSAEKACTELGIQTANDAVKLAEAKGMVYLKGFTDGILEAGPHAGKKVGAGATRFRYNPPQSRPGHGPRWGGPRTAYLPGRAASLVADHQPPNPPPYLAQVSDAKPIIREELLASGDAMPYSEPERAVVSRSGDECVVALTDQWYLVRG